MHWYHLWIYRIRLYHIYVLSFNRILDLVLTYGIETEHLTIVPEKHLLSYHFLITFKLNRFFPIQGLKTVFTVDGGDGGGDGGIYCTVLGANILILMVYDSGYCGFIKASMKFDILLGSDEPETYLSYAAKDLCSILCLSGGAERKSTGSCKLLVYV